MKKNVFFFGLILSLFIISCQPKTTNETTVAATDSSMIAKDNTQTASTGSTNSAAMPVTAATDTSSTMTTAKPDPAKKGKKGKVSIAMSAPAPGDMVPDKEGYYTNAEVLPAYPGGQKSLEKFFEDNVQYPLEASDNGVEGTVNVNFAVDENGKIYTPKVKGQKIGYGVEEEALRVISKMPKWTPGRIKGKNVKTRFNLPVKFQLL